MKNLRQFIVIFLLLFCNRFFSVHKDGFENKRIANLCKLLTERKNFEKYFSITQSSTQNSKIDTIVHNIKKQSWFVMLSMLIFMFTKSTFSGLRR